MTFLSELKDKQVLIFGAGVTGKSTEVFLKEYGCKITVIDEKGTGGSIQNFKDISLQDFNLAVVSPGWRLNHPLIEEARSFGIEFLSEVDLAWRVKSEVNSNQVWYAITGTNGKTTTVQMAEKIFREGGISARACGNVGDTVIELAGDSSISTLILELSSFQLNWSDECQFSAGAIINIAEDHIDWHGTFQNYLAAKMKLAPMSQKMIINGDDVNLAKVRDLNSQTYSYTLQTPTKGEIENARIDIKAAIETAAREVPLTKANSIIAVAGTATTVAAAALDLPAYDRYAIHLSRIPSQKVHEISEMFLTMNRDERLALGYMHPGRVDVIAAGSLILSEILNEIGAQEFIASESDILDGMAYKLASS